MTSVVVFNDLCTKIALNNPVLIISENPGLQCDPEQRVRMHVRRDVASPHSAWVITSPTSRN